MDDALFWHRIQFGFTVTYHYLFPQLTMGLALLIVLFKWRGLRGDARADEAARFWTKVFGAAFAMGVVTGIPMEFQFGTNWARFSKATGGVIGQTLAMEGMFAFFLESSFLGALLYGEKRLGPRLHFAAAVALFVGSWLSGYFIIVTNAFMQHPVGHAVDANGQMHVVDLAAFLLNPWALAQYAHNMCGSVVTAAFVVAGTGAFWRLSGISPEGGAASLRMGVVVGAVASLLQAMPTGDIHGRQVAEHQPAALAAMEGLFHGGPGAELAIIGQPDVKNQRLDNPIVVPKLLSFLAYGSFGSTVKGIADFPPDQRPDNIELLYYSYHVMVGLGTLFIALMGLAALQLWRGRLFDSPALQWALMLAIPFPFIANTAGWMTAELGRQPWLVYGLMRTAEGTSPRVGVGSTLFTAIGFAGLYLVLGLVFLWLVAREVGHGPDPAHEAAHPHPPLPTPGPAAVPGGAPAARHPEA